MDPLKCFLISSRKKLNKELSLLIKEKKIISLIKTFPKSENTTTYIKKNDVDIVFYYIGKKTETSIDTWLKDQDSFHLISLVDAAKKENINSEIINQSNSLTLPLNYTSFSAIIEKIKDFYALPKFKNDKYIIFKKGDDLIKIKIKEICFVKALNEYVIIYTHLSRYTIQLTIDQMEVMLIHKGFLRIHALFLIQINKINAIGKAHVIINEKKIPINKKYQEQFMSHFREL